MASEARTTFDVRDLLNQRALALLMVAWVTERIAAIEAQLPKDFRTARPQASSPFPTCSPDVASPTHAYTTPLQQAPAVATPAAELPIPAAAAAAAAAAEPQQFLQQQIPAADQQQPQLQQQQQTPAAACASFTVSNLPSLPLNAEAADGDEILSELVAAAAAAAAAAGLQQQQQPQIPAAVQQKQQQQPQNPNPAAERPSLRFPTARLLNAAVQSAR